MGKEIITQVQETQRVPIRINRRWNTPSILIKWAKIKHREQILKAAREKQQTTHKGIFIRITADLSIETLQAIYWLALLLDVYFLHINFLMLDFCFKFCPFLSPIFYTFPFIYFHFMSFVLNKHWLLLSCSSTILVR